MPPTHTIHAQFCRLLGRLKANYQLSELIKATSYLDWLSLCCDFTIKSCQNWQLSTNSIHYLLALWGRLVAAVPYVRPDAGPNGHSKKLEESVSQVIKCFITCMLGSVRTIVEEGVDDPLDDEGSLRDQLERLPVICRFQYVRERSLSLARARPVPPLSTFARICSLVLKLTLASLAGTRRRLSLSCSRWTKLWARIRTPSRRSPRTTSQSSRRRLSRSSRGSWRGWCTFAGRSWAGTAGAPRTWTTGRRSSTPV